MFSDRGRKLIMAVGGFLPAILAVILSDRPSLSGLAALSGLFFAFFTMETRMEGIITPLPAISWLACAFGGPLSGLLTTAASVVTGLVHMGGSRPVRDLYTSLIPASAMIIVHSWLFGMDSNSWLLIPAGFLVQSAAARVISARTAPRLAVTGVNWLINGMAAFTVLYFVALDGFPGALVVFGVMAIFVLHSVRTGAELARYSGRIGVLSVQNRLMSHLYGDEHDGMLFFDDGTMTWTMLCKPAREIPYPDSAEKDPDGQWTVFRTGRSAFIADRKVSSDLLSLQPAERTETLMLLEKAWRAAFAKKRLENAFLGAAGMLVRIADKKDSDTHRHSLRVADTAVRLGMIIGLSESELFQLRIGAMLHDIGKLTIPENLIMKKGLLTEEERAVLETHPRAGARLLEPMERYAGASSVVMQHHERIDGSGYPLGLRGRQISLNARIVAVADTFDAIVSPRAYHLGKPPHIALREIRKLTGTWYDPAVVDALEIMLG